MHPPGDLARARPNGPGRAYLKQARRLLHGGADFTHHTAQCLCGAPRDAHAGAAHKGRCPLGRGRYRPDPAYDLAYNAFHARVADHVDVVNTWQAAEYPRPAPRPGGTGVGPSDHGSCKRRIQYRELGLPDGFTEDQVNELAAIIGQLIHDALLRAFAHSCPWRYFEHPVPLPGLDRWGRVDMYDPITGIVTDIKTVGGEDERYEYGWEMLREDGPPDYWWKQDAEYAYALQCAGEEPETLHIMAVRRSTGEVEHFYRDYDEKFALAARGELQALNANLELARQGLLDLPRLADGGPTRNRLCRDYCRFKSACWNIPQAAATRRSPESYTLLGGVDVDEDEAAYASELLYEWRRSERDAKKAVNDTRTLLIGVPDGTYGDYEVSASPGHSPLYKDYYQAVQDALESGADPEKILEEIRDTHLTHSHKETINVRLTRAAQRKPTTPDTPQESP